MIRANLLPRPKENARIFGIEIDIAYLRQALAGLLTVALVAALGVGIEELAVHRLRADAMARETQLAARAGERAQSKQLALDVARYQAFAREADFFRRSGSVAALAVARIGNTVPPTVWLESLERDGDGYTLTGGSNSVDVLSGALLALDNALPQTSASLLSIDNHTTGRDGVRFRAQLHDSVATAAPVSTR
ncbi:MAG: PilN domain-containing protein [Candidatus Eremiobacteraeota bacterium]|nr:PilN domain-containing protein [Candidatus Eremiobacteraeota bacterium]